MFFENLGDDRNGRVDGVGDDKHKRLGAVLSDSSRKISDDASVDLEVDC